MTLSATPAVAIEFDAGVWTDVSSLTRAATWRRGRSNESDQFSAGRGTAVLDNSDREFDPEHVAGTYYGKLLPRKRIRIGFTYGATTYWKFYGFIDGWPQSYDGPTDATVTVRATDAFKVFARARVPSEWQQTIEAETTVTAWYRLGEGSGTIAADASDNKQHGTYAGGATFNQRSGLIFGDSDGAIGFDGTDDYVTLPFGAAVDTANPYTIEFWIEKASELTGNDEVIYEQSQGQTTDSPGVVSILIRGTTGGDGQVNFAHITSGASAIIDSGVRIDDGARHHVVAVGTGATARLYVDGVLCGSSAYTAASSAVTWLRIGDGKLGSFTDADAGHFLNATVDEFIIHDDDLDATTIAAHYTAGTAPRADESPTERITAVLDYIGWSAGDRDLDAGSAVLLPATFEANALPILQDVETSEGGRLFVDRTGRLALIGRSNFLTEAVYKTSNATFGDDGVDLPYQSVGAEMFGFDDDAIVNEARVRQSGGSEQVVADQTSIDDYGLMSKSETTLESRPGVIRNRAEYLVNRYKDPLLRMPAVRLLPERDPATLYPLIGTADIGYRYTFNRTPQGVGSAISKDFHLEGESGSVSPASISIEWELSPAETSWVWGDDWPIRWSY